MSTCGTCKEEISIQKPGGICVACKSDHHLSCLTGGTRSKLKCNVCVGVPQYREPESFGLPGFAEEHAVAGGLSSTMVSERTAREVRLEQEMAELRATVRDLTQQSSSLAGKTQSMSYTPSTNNEEQASGSASQLNRSQRAIMNSICIEPLTKAQLECRRNAGPLPKFSGLPGAWFQFISSYKDAAAKCGFSATENMRRIAEALLEPARSTVEHLLSRPHKLEKVLSVLEQNFGRPEVMLAYAEDMAREMRPLQESLGNLSEFYADVMTVQDTLELMDEDNSYVSLVEGVIRNKLCLQHGREWLSFRGSRPTTISLFGEYVEQLLEQVQQLRQHQFPSTRAENEDQGTKGKRTMRVMVQSDAPVVESTNTSPTTNSCILACGNSHPLPQCPTFLSMSVQDRWNVVRNKNRCNSCLAKHFLRRCTNRRPCPEPGCTYYHHPLLHYEPRAPTAGPSHVVLGLSQRPDPRTIYPVVPVTITANGQSRSTYALLDTGSSISLVSTNLARSLGLRGTRTTLSMAWTDNAIRSVATEQVRICIRGTHVEQVRNGTSDVLKSEVAILVNTNDDLSLPLHTVPLQLLQDEGLDDLPLIPTDGVVPQLLIGLDQAQLIAALDTRVGVSGKLLANRTALGWVLMGKTQTERFLTIKHSEQDFNVETDGRINVMAQQEQIELAAGLLCTSDAATCRNRATEQGRRGLMGIRTNAEETIKDVSKNRQLHKKGECTNDPNVLRAGGAAQQGEGMVSQSDSTVMGVNWQTMTEPFPFHARMDEEGIRKKALHNKRQAHLDVLLVMQRNQELTQQIQNLCVQLQDGYEEQMQLLEKAQHCSNEVDEQRSGHQRKQQPGESGPNAYAVEKQIRSVQRVSNLQLTVEEMGKEKARINFPIEAVQIEDFSWGSVIVLYVLMIFLIICLPKVMYEVRQPSQSTSKCGESKNGSLGFREPAENLTLEPPDQDIARVGRSKGKLDDLLKESDPHGGLEREVA